MYRRRRRRRGRRRREREARRREEGRRRVGVSRTRDVAANAAAGKLKGFVLLRYAIPRLYHKVILSNKREEKKQTFNSNVPNSSKT